MRVFVTGATGWIGSAVVSELLTLGHQVTGLTTSHKGAEKLRKLGAKACIGKLADLAMLREEAGKSEGVIHTAFIHSLSHMSLGTRLRLFAGALNGGIGQSFMQILAETETQAVAALGNGLKGSGNPLVVISGIVNLPQGRVATEQDKHGAAPNRSFSEKAAFDFISLGVRASAVRLPPTVHAAGDQGFIDQFIQAARKKRVSPYIGDGNNRWAAVHRLDAAKLLCLALEKGGAGATYHGVAETGIPFREIASLIARDLNLPTASVDAKKAAKHFGMLSIFVGLDNPASSEWTRQALGWEPVRQDLLSDMDANYFRGRALAR